MKELEQSHRPVRYYIVKTEQDAEPIVRSVPVARVIAAPAVEPAAVAPTPVGGEGDARSPRTGDKAHVGRLARAAAVLRRHPAR